MYNNYLQNSQFTLQGVSPNHLTRKLRELSIAMGHPQLSIYFGERGLHG